MNQSIMGKYEVYQEAALKGRHVRNNISHNKYNTKEAVFFSAANLIAIVSQKYLNFEKKYDDMCIYAKETQEDGSKRTILKFTIQLTNEKGEADERN